MLLVKKQVKTELFKGSNCVVAAIISSLLFTGSTCVQATTINQQFIVKKTSDHVISPNKLNTQVIRKPHYQPKIQLAILLDTSGSMEGLIDQTRNQIWQVVNEFSTVKRQGVTPILEVALFEYGNDGNPKSNGFVRKLNNFTRELDKVSEGLFSLSTNGGSEFCGMAIQAAVNGLQWSQSDKDIKTIFIAGNEAFTQGPVHYQAAINLAKQQGISVNTIFAGSYKAGIQTGWQSGALLAGGDYMSIDTEQKVFHVDAPQDKKIAELNNQLNQTYIPYGKAGNASVERQIKQDETSNGISSALLAKRVKSKSSSFYKNSSWDLVDALSEGKVKESELGEIQDGSLPEPMKKMTVKERKNYVLKKAEEREKVKKEIASLSKKREQYVAQKKAKQVANAPSMNEALTKAIKKQAQEKGYQLNSEK
ncbi:VWA domain-containing protein [Aliikangiella sp. IMCC44359]|uniref:VWA domain-containing protein n=1 Tax=Aliikangiella sp. IMCC44359 TaxID=3459125 RepID=UPI00403AD389